jgi:hypothetical protein
VTEPGEPIGHVDVPAAGIPPEEVDEDIGVEEVAAGKHQLSSSRALLTSSSV